MNIEDIAYKRSRHLKIVKGLERISGGFCNYEILEELPDDIIVKFTYGVQSDCSDSVNSHTERLSKEYE